MSTPLQKELRYKGLAAVPDAYNAPDGQLEVCHNLVAEDDALHPLQPPTTLAQLPGTDIRQVYVHKVASDIHNYIILADGLLKYFTVTDGRIPAEPTTTDIDIADLPTVDHIDAIGNTLLLFTADGICYFLWKSDARSYLRLGTHIPECALSFGLQAEMKRTDEFPVEYWHDCHYLERENGDNYVHYHFDPDDEDTGTATNAVIAKVNKFIAEEADEKGKFIFPFLVRYAYRLYDGSLTMHSAPILMIPSSGVTPMVLVKNIHTNTDTLDALSPNWLENSFDRVTGVDCEVAAPVCSLDYVLQSLSTGIQNWSDIVKSVDIFVSAPIYTYDQSGRLEHVVYRQLSVDNQQLEEIFGFSISKLTNIAPGYHYGTGQGQTYIPVDSSIYPPYYSHRSVMGMYALAFDNIPPNGAITARIDLPRKDSHQVLEEFRSCANFYLLKSIPIEELSTERTILDIPKNYLSSLVDREAMTDDLDSHDHLVSKYSHIYNSRINLANVSKRLFNGFHPNACFPYNNGFISPFAPSRGNILTSYEVLVFIRQDGGEYVLKSPGQGQASFFGIYNLVERPHNPYNPFYYFFYPNPNAYKAQIIFRENVYSVPVEEVIELPLKPHDFLNGAYFFDGFESQRPRVGTHVSPSPNPVVSLPNKLYTSEVNNPFLFKATGVNTIGTGTILGISSATKALSQGQFGQFPLYAFTTEGVWALETTSQGTYSAKQPITRDACISGDTITQLDDAVLFATTRGMMLISGAQTNCITDIISQDYPLDITTLPGFPEIERRCGLDNSCHLQPASEFLARCQSLFNYADRYILLYNPKYSYAYLYSLKSNNWSTLPSNIKLRINSYPEALAITTDNKLVSLSQTVPAASPAGQEATVPGASAPVVVGENSLNRVSPFSGESQAPALLLTRPLKLDQPDLLKTITAIIQRGHFRRGHVSTVLYGSRDLTHWHLITSSVDHKIRLIHGTPYKYFRLLLLPNLAPAESLTGATIQFNPRQANHPR